MARHKARRTFEGGLRRGAAKRACVRPPQTADTYQAISNYAGDAGGGSQTLSTSDTWRAALLGTVAAGALFFGYGRSARAGCVGDGTTLTCTGDLEGTDVVNGGIAVTGANYDTLDVNALNADIAPDPGVKGIHFISGDNVTIESDTGPFAIITIGNFADGIYANSFSGTGNVTVTQTGDITTDGEHSDGIWAFSYFGDVTVTQTGDITTLGDNAEGIYARSYYGTVTVTQTGTITTDGEHSDGIYARSRSGNVTVTQTGDITATGIDSEGIFAYSGTGDIDITLNGGTIYSAQAEGVEFSRGVDNTLTINNTVTISGETTDILGGDGDETINNYGTLTTLGDIDLGGGTNAFNNWEGAVFNSGDTVDLGPGVDGVNNVFTNWGEWSPFGTDTGTTDVTGGDLNLKPGSALVMDVDPGDTPEADKIDMTAGDGQATADGGLVVNFSQLTGATGDQFVLIETNQEILVQGLELSAAVNAEIEYLDSETDVVLTLTSDDLIDFAADGLNRNQTSIAEHLDAAFDMGPTALDPVLNGLLYTFGLEAYKNALDQLSPEIYVSTQIAALYASLEFSNNLLSCRVNGTNTASINREGQCVWVGAKARFLNSDRTSQNIGFDETAGLFAAGAQVALDPVWRLGFGVGYQKSSLDTDVGAESDGDQVQGGIALKYNPGALLLAGVVSGGRGWYDTTRPMAFGDFSETAQGDHEIDVLAGRLHASYVFGSPHFYYKPMIDAAVTRLDVGDVTESYADGAGLVVQGDVNTVLSLSPALELGTQWWLGNGTLVRPFVRAGATWFSDDNVTVSASFAGTPDGVDPFTIRTEMDQVQADVAAGVEMINSEESNLRVYYDGHFGDTTRIHSVGFKGSAKF